MKPLIRFNNVDDQIYRIHTQDAMVGISQIIDQKDRIQAWSTIASEDGDKMFLIRDMISDTLFDKIDENRKNNETNAAAQNLRVHPA